MGGLSPGFESPALALASAVSASNQGVFASSFAPGIQLAHASLGSGGTLSDASSDFGTRRRLPGDDGVVPTADEGPPVRFPPWPELVTPFNLPGFFPRVIYRKGGTSPNNLKPRAGEDYVSFRDSLSNPYPKNPDQRPVFKPGDDYLVVDVSKLPPGSVFKPGDVPGHIGVRNVPPEVLKDAIIFRGRLPAE